MPETHPPKDEGRAASNLPPLSLHIPEPRYRPGDTPDFGDIDVPAVEATPRPGEATKPDAMRELSYGLVRVLDFDGQAKGQWDPKLTPERLRVMLRYMMLVRAFDDRMKRAAYERQGGVCPYCGEHFELSEMHADHIVPWSKGGTTDAANCEMLCKPHNRAKGNR